MFARHTGYDAWPNGDEPRYVTPYTGEMMPESCPASVLGRGLKLPSLFERFGGGGVGPDTGGDWMVLGCVEATVIADGVGVA